MQWDNIVGGVSHEDQRMQFSIHEKNKEGFYEIECDVGGRRKTKF